MRFVKVICFVAVGLSLLVGASQQISVNVGSEEVDFFNNFLSLLMRGMVGQNYKEVVDKLLQNETLTLTDVTVSSNPKLCLTCRLVFYTLIKMTRRRDIPQATVEVVGRTLCRLTGRPIHVCNGIARININSFTHIVQARPDLIADDFCRQMLEDVGCSDSKRSNPTRQQVVITPKVKEYNNSGKTGKPLKILHIGDIHMDQEYVVGAESDCDSGACCRYIDPFRVRHNKWGDLGHCDQPAFAFQHALEQMAVKHKDIDVIYMTGNIIHHHSWDLTKSYVTRDIRKAAAVVKAKLAFRDVPVVLALGNHDTHTVGMFSPEEAGNVGHGYLYKDFEDGLKTKFYVRPGLEFPPNHEGYYSVKLRDGLKLIVLNNNIANIYNWWLLHPNSTFYVRQLQYLYDTLEKAELNGDRVHILAHLPPRSKLLLADWSAQYGKIADRFAHVIAAEFNGNTHLDEFRLTFRGKEAIGVAWNAGSLAAYSGVNPSYRVYEVDSKSYTVNNHQTYFFELEETNRKNVKPSWKQEYDMKKAYNLQDLKPSSLQNFVKKLSTDETVFKKYYSYQLRGVVRNCSEECRRETLCNIIGNEHCKALISK
uniref:Sphingomyelin phosphodiesterase n=1 Tax=Culex tarsalis TaxID=7177 RepID=A0A1Q3FAA1_CULTA